MLESLSVTIDALVSATLHHPVQAMGVYLLAGLLSSLFPCVYPLIPVTVGYLQKRSTPGTPLWIHPFFYWFGTVIAYTLLGIIAAVGGGAFNRLMQNGVVISLTGFLFLFLTFSILDWYPLNFSGGMGLVERTRSRKNFLFTILMGFGAGFVASACVAPALVTMLLFIAQGASSGGFKIVYILYGGFLSAAFGAGLGIPFFLSGVLGARLPRSGAWMNRVKVTFAVLIFAAAIYQIYKGFTAMGYQELDILVLFLGLALIGLAAFLGLKPASREDRVAFTRFLFSLFALALGIAAVISGINPGLRNASGSAIPPKKEASSNNGLPVYKLLSSEEMKRRSGQVDREIIASLPFYRDGSFAFTRAHLDKKPLFLDFYADWCTNCKDFYRILASDTDLQKSLSGAVILKIKDTDPVFDTFLNDPRFPELKIGLPFFAILNSDGSLRWKTTNYRDTRGMIENLP